jgi:xanthine dehydrogenase iron-sulfur cluster and FAD-binding subunit A
LGTVDGLHAIQEAFWEKHGLQCGYCTPAMLMTAVELVEGNPNPSHDEIQTPFATVIDVAGVARAKRVNFAPPSHQRPSVLPD